MSAIPLLRADFSAPQAAPPPPTGTNFGAADAVMTGVAGFIRSSFEAAQSHRNNLGINERLLASLRAVRGEYDAETLSAIRTFGGSEVYARVTAGKVRTVSALLREVYTTTDRPWAASATPVPDFGGDSIESVVRERLTAEVMDVHAAAGNMEQQAQMVMAQLQQAPPEAAQDPEVAQQMQTAAAAAQSMMENAAKLREGMTVDRLRERAVVLRGEVMDLRKKQADEELHQREDVLDDYLTEGGFYEALWAFLGDVAGSPVGIIKGPVVRMVNKLKWVDGVPTPEQTPVPTWERCSAFDVFFAPWSQKVTDGYVIHRERVSRSAVHALRGHSSYSAEIIDECLANWGSMSCGWYDHTETERAHLENRTSDQDAMNRDPLAETKPLLSYYGPIPREYLISWGVPADVLPVDQPDPNVFAYLLGSKVIGIAPNPHPAGNPPFYTDSYERVPDSVYGHGLPDILDDIQAVSSATLRALTNNLSMASGPMAWVNEDRMVDNDPNSHKLHPWKIWRFTDANSSSGDNVRPMEFFQPNSNAEQLLMVYERLQTMADEVSSVPRYMNGNGAGVGGAGRTAAGLSMLMEAGGRNIKQTVGSIDSNVVEKAVKDLNVYLSLTNPELVANGDIEITARGATELLQKETLRMRRLEFLNITNNPIDMQIVGAEGRFHLLRELARDLQLPVRDSISFSAEEMEQLTQMMKAQMLQQGAGAGPNGNAPPPGGGNPDPQGQPQNHPKQQPSAGVARGPDMDPGR